MLDTKKNLKAYKKTMQFLPLNDNATTLALSRLKTGGKKAKNKTSLVILEYFPLLFLGSN